MASKIDQFWEIFKAVSGDTSSNVIESTNAIAKSDRTKVESYFSNVIDQYTFSTSDYNRFRKFLIDLYASFRAQSTISLKSTDPHVLSNSDLDELFRSMGYNLSSSLRGFDENPLEQKVQFFLDLINLYKVKGTPQSLVDVLQYYGVTEVDIYEFFLKKDTVSSLFFDGKAVAGTTINPNGVALPFNSLTSSDPHWLYTSSQILQLDQLNKINLPSKTPYLGIQPSVDLEGAEMAIVERHVQDQYDYYVAHGTVPTANAEITYIGETRSLLELYLSCIYMFDKIFDYGSIIPARFLCYDGTSTNDAVIMQEFTTLTQAKVKSRDSLKIRYNEYLGLFSRSIADNFLVNENTAGTLLNTIAPDIKIQLDTAGAPVDVLYSLLKDLALWVRSNIGFGFVNFGFILFGIQEFFEDLKPVIDFFKPYRARLVLLESLLVKNRLFNTIVVEDEFNTTAEVGINDFLTGNSIPCKVVEDIIIPENLYTTNIPIGTNNVIINLNETMPDTSYSIGISIRLDSSDTPETPIEFETLVTNKTTSYFQVKLSGYVPTDNYYVDWYVVDSVNSSIANLSDGTTSFVITLPQVQADTNYVISGSFANNEDPDPSPYGYIITEKTTTTFKLITSSALDTSNYTYEYFICENTDCETVNITEGITEIGVTYPIPFADNSFPLLVNLEGDSTGVYTWTITKKTLNGFKVSFPSSIPTSNYVLSWQALETREALNPYTKQIISGTKTVSLFLKTPQANADYGLGTTIRFDSVADPSEIVEQFPYIITEKTTEKITLTLSDTVPSDNYYVDWYIDDYPADSVSIPFLSSSIVVTLPVSQTDTNYAIEGVLKNIVDSPASIYFYTITSKTTTGFTVTFSSPIDSPNYMFDYFTRNDGSVFNTDIEDGASTLTVIYPHAFSNNNYILLTTLESDNDVYSWIVSERSEYEFTVQLSSPTQNPNYILTWMVLQQIESQITVCQREFISSIPTYTWKALWEDNTLYNYNDAVSTAGFGEHYVCIQEHTSTRETKPVGGEEWTLYWRLMSEMECKDLPGIPSYYSRDTFDCGSYFDIGAVTDIKQDIEIEISDDIHDHLRCPAADGTGFVVSELLEYTFKETNIPIGTDSAIVYLNTTQPNTNYSIGLSIRFDPVDPVEIPEEFAYLVTSKYVDTFSIKLSGIVPSSNYYVSWDIIDSTTDSDIVQLNDGTSSFVITLPQAQPDINYAISGALTNTIDSSSSIYNFTVTEKTSTDFKITFSGIIDSPNYTFEYFINRGSHYGNAPITIGSNLVDVVFSTPVSHTGYQVTTLLQTDDDNIYAWTVIEKTIYGFKVELSSNALTSNYKLSWIILNLNALLDQFSYYQSGGFRNFDEGGTFDCTHGFDLIQITMEAIP